jgi:hypothetical protein
MESKQISPEQLEKYSSAITLSDMEIFVFPELMYSLVLANIMSPIMWKWRDADCFRKLQGKSSYKKLMRLRQFIIDEYEFNLDLETWGLTDRKKELARFEKFIAPEQIARSNALFGYAGDKYYFDVDIRRHFGLDKYDSDIIPYWKTETVEAMDAFRFKPGYEKRAGECVSLAALYAAAVFVVCGIPLEEIYMILTPLHSQNFIDIQDGVLTNNRRLVTKAMWFNGTAISNKAQRALRNEQVTILAHSSGYIHCLYKDATIDKNAYKKFRTKLGQFLTTELTPLMFANFLRSYSQYQKHFIFCHHFRGEEKFIKAEDLFRYEHGSKFRIADATFEKLIAEVSEEDFAPYKLPERVCFEHLYRLICKTGIDVRKPDGRDILKSYVAPRIPEADSFTEDLAEFLHLEAKLPESDKNYIPSKPVKIQPDWTREQIIDYLQSIRPQNITADLAFYAYRDMETCDWLPFIKAAIERNPVSIQQLGDMPVEKVKSWLNELDNTSIYDGKRLAQPDEVVNFQRADGIEKAFLLANIIRSRQPQQPLEILIDRDQVLLKSRQEHRFVSGKGIKKHIIIPPLDKESTSLAW